MTNIEVIKKVQSGFLQTGRDQIRTGMEVEVYQIIKEGNKQRVQRFKGLVIKIAGKSDLEKTITVRRKIGAFGVEKIFALHSSSIEKIEILRQFKVKRKSIKFIRDLTGRAARLKEVKNMKYEKAPEINASEIKTSQEVPKDSQEVPKDSQEVPPEKKSDTPDDKIKDSQEVDTSPTKDDDKIEKKQESASQESENQEKNQQNNGEKTSEQENLDEQTEKTTDEDTNSSVTENKKEEK